MKDVDFTLFNNGHTEEENKYHWINLAKSIGKTGESKIAECTDSLKKERKPISQLPAKSKSHSFKELLDDYSKKWSMEFLDK